MNSPLKLETLTAVVAAMLFSSPAARAVDADHDGLDDAWQTAYNIAAFTGSADPDGDGRPNLVESLNWTDPTDSAHPNAGWGLVVIGDADGDQLDDVWFAQHSSGGSLTTLGDPDGDQRTNLEESITGTNPWVADQPWAYMSSTPTTASGPGSFTLSFHSVAGMSYLIERSTDLVTWSNDQQVWGDGSVKAITIATGTADRMFFRVGLQQTNGGGLDSDGDGLLDWYEVNVFGTNPLLADTDGDGIGDAQEVAEGTDPVDTASNSGYVPGVLDGWAYRSFPITGAGTGPVTTEDADGDGLVDAWEVTHFGSAGVRNGHHDADGDGLVDAEEFAQALLGPLRWDSDGDGRRDAAGGGAAGAGSLLLSADGRAGHHLAR